MENKAIKKQLIVYQAETFDIRLSESSVNLVISSPPLDILLNRARELFEWLDACVAQGGVLLLDIPGQYNQYTIAMHEGVRKTAWRFQWGFAYYDFYQKGDTQSLCAYARSNVPKPLEVPYRTCTEREMVHRCEYDQSYIENLVENFTNPGQTVLDPFCGTGGVPRTAYRLERNAIGIDRRCPFTNEL